MILIINLAFILSKRNVDINNKSFLSSMSEGTLSISILKVARKTHNATYNQQQELFSFLLHYLYKPCDFTTLTSLING